MPVPLKRNVTCAVSDEMMQSFIPACIAKARWVKLRYDAQANADGHMKGKEFKTASDEFLKELMPY